MKRKERPTQMVKPVGNEDATRPVNTMTYRITVQMLAIFSQKKAIEFTGMESTIERDQDGNYILTHNKHGVLIKSKDALMVVCYFIELEHPQVVQKLLNEPEPFDEIEIVFDDGTTDTAEFLVVS